MKNSNVLRLHLGDWSNDLIVIICRLSLFEGKTILNVRNVRYCDYVVENYDNCSLMERAREKTDKSRWERIILHSRFNADVIRWRSMMAIN